jgi:hypothetical protein
MAVAIRPEALGGRPSELDLALSNGVAQPSVDT